MIIKSQSGTAIREEDRLAIATLLVKIGYTVRLVTLRENGKPQKAIEYLERKKRRMTNPCEKCKKKPNCPRVCYPRRDYERAIRKKGGAKKWSK